MVLPQLQERRLYSGDIRRRSRCSFLLGFRLFSRVQAQELAGRKEEGDRFCNPGDSERNVTNVLIDGPRLHVGSEQTGAERGKGDDHQLDRYD